MVCGALIEARSCERFAALAPGSAAPPVRYSRDCMLRKPVIIGCIWNWRAAPRLARGLLWLLESRSSPRVRRN